jgi:copper oxidase (laccase) domain-containing protein
MRPGGRGPDEGPGLVELAEELGRAVGRVTEPSDIDDASLPKGVAWATQVHGADVLVVGSTSDKARARHLLATSVVDRALSSPEGLEGCRHVGTADALIAIDSDVAVAVLTADCCPVALATPEGLVAAVHAGWRGLVAGVIEATAQRLRTLGATEIVGVLGPCIHPASYAFSDDDLAQVEALYGPSVRGRTTSGGPALDLPAAVEAAFGRGGIRPLPGVGSCTAQSDRFFSHRARGDGGRQALVVWWSGRESFEHGGGGSGEGGVG